MRTTVMIFETHPAVRAGLYRRLTAEEGIVVLGVFSDIDDFAAMLARFNPDVALVSMFGSRGVDAAVVAVRSAPHTKVVVLAPPLHNGELKSLPKGVIVVHDGPRGDRVAGAVLGRAKEEPVVSGS